MSKRPFNDNDLPVLTLVPSHPDWSQRETALIASMMQVTARRGHEAKLEERRMVMRFCQRHPTMTLEVAEGFFAKGDHLR